MMPSDELAKLLYVLLPVLAALGAHALPGGSGEGHERPPLPSAEELAKLPPDGGERFNRLVFEQSPYLLQHAANPVDWYPWGEEAFAAARERDVPIFLSVGYSTCHWCHVMERESFEDEEVAALLNANFVCIKVDREERPDLDTVYMTVTQGMTGSGGWPMTIVMTPDARPFFAGTYIPKHSRFGRRGMMELLPTIAEVWRTRRDDVVRDAERIVESMRRTEHGSPGGELDAETLELAFQQLRQSYDEPFGGFGHQPKFPVPHNLVFLLQYQQRHGDARALAMAEKTLRAMRAGGIYDHVGFGFHRYSTDREWLVPHFEKMLYDQAQLAMAYVAAWQVSGANEYRRTAEEILTYVERDMTSPEGGFYSAEDADSEGEEGLFYLWTADEMREVLGTEDAPLALRAFGVEERGNFHDEASGQPSPRNILHLPQTLEELAAAEGMEQAELEASLELAREKLFAVRERRVHPLKDDKVLTDWNGLMIAALARAAVAFDEPRYAERARRAADFVLRELVDDRGRLLKRWRAGRAGLPGTLDDHAFLSWGLLELYEATFDVRYLHEARRLVDLMLAHFEDGEHGGFYLGADDGEELFVRAKEVYDGAIPSGNSVAAFVLLRLGRITAEERYEERAAALMRAFSGRVAEAPAAHTQLLAAVDFAVGPSFEIVLAGDPAAEDTRALERAIGRRFVPNKVLLLRPDDAWEGIAKIAPYTREQASVGGRATVYVCRDFACRAPTHEIGEVIEALVGGARAPDGE